MTGIVVASMIGAGVYTTSGFALSDLGSPSTVMAAWLVGAIIALCGAVGYGLLAKRLAENGGEYLYLSRHVHPSVGALAGWVSFFAGFTGAAAYAALAFEAYALPDGTRPAWLPSGSLSVALVLVALIMHVLNTRWGAWLQNVLVVSKLLLLIAFLGFAWVTADALIGGLPNATDESSSATPEFSWQAFATTVMWISLSYSGFNAAIYVAGESERGGTSVARSMVIGTVLVAVLYLLLNATVFASTPIAELTGQPDVVAIAAKNIGGDPAETWVRILICLGLFTSVSSAVMVGPRVYAKMAAEGVFPRFFASDQPPPVRAIVLQAASVIAVILFSGIQSLMSTLSMTLSLCAAGTVATIFMRSAHPAEAPSTSSFSFPKLLAALYVVATLIIAGVAATHRPKEAFVALGAFVLCVILVVVGRRQQQH